jgi:long-subunit acyl-CoA synthetase (AMP-forming)
VAPGDRVALLSKNTAHWMMSDFAIWLAECEQPIRWTDDHDR